MNGETGSEQGNGRKRRLLIVDDDRDFVEGLADVLQSRGYEIEAAHSAEGGEQKIRDFHGGVALLDIRLGGASGIDLIPKLCRARPGILCVVMTAYAGTDTAIEALQSGAYDYLRKPLDVRELLSTLDRCYDRIALEKQKVAAEQALVVQNVELQKINTRLRAIVDTSRNLAYCSGIEDMGQLILEEFSRNMTVDGGSLFFRQNGVLVLAHTLDPGHAPRTIKLPLRTGSLFEKAMSQREPVLIENIEEAHDLLGSGWKAYRNNSALVLPILKEDRELIGLVALHNKKQPPFTPQDREIGMILASYACEVFRATQAREDLRKSEARFRQIYDAAPVMMHSIGIDGTIRNVNKKWLNELGYERDEVVGHTLQSFMTPDSQKALNHGLPRFWHQQRVANLPFQFVRRDGSIVDALLDSVIVDDPIWGNVSLSAIRDVTHEVQLRTQLLQAQKMEAIGTLSGGIAHDFNNLLQVIQGYAELALFNSTEGQSGHSELREIKEAAQRAAELTKGLLTFSRRVESKLRPVDLNRELRSVTKMLIRTIPKMIKIQLNLAEGLHTIKADPAQLQQVVMNLAVNARDAMPEGGTLLIKSRNWELDDDFCTTHLGMKPGKYALLTVSDNGCGMAKPIVDRVFEPFYTTKAQGKGTGLGLSIVYGIVKSHDGHISCYSEAGTGTVFRIYIPAVEKTKGTENRGNALPIQRGTETILLVDDEEALRKLGASILTKFGYKVITACNGKECLDIYHRSETTISLIVLDLIMPEMGGVECLQQILAIDASAKVIIASGYSADDHLDHVLEKGAKRLLRKPYEARPMLELIRRVLDEPQSRL